VLDVQVLTVQMHSLAMYSIIDCIWPRIWPWQLLLPPKQLCEPYISCRNFLSLSVRHTRALWTKPNNTLQIFWYLSPVAISDYSENN